MIIFRLEAEKISYDSKILSIEVKKGEEVRIWKSWEFLDEKKLISDFTKWFLEEKDKILIGFNILKFDIPLLLLKTSKFEEFGEFSLKLNRSNILDLFVVLTFLHKGNIKGFKYYCKKYGVNGIVPREKILDLYKEKKYEEMEKALVRNLNAFEGLFEKVLKEF
jgi:DNA polymerase elongation subunit (family B)